MKKLIAVAVVLVAVAVLVATSDEPEEAVAGDYPCMACW